MYLISKKDARKVLTFGLIKFDHFPRGNIRYTNEFRHMIGFMFNFENKIRGMFEQSKLHIYDLQSLQDVLIDIFKNCIKDEYDYKEAVDSIINQLKNIEGICISEDNELYVSNIDAIERKISSPEIMKNVAETIIQNLDKYLDHTKIVLFADSKIRDLY